MVKRNLHQARPAKPAKRRSNNANKLSMRRCVCRPPVGVFDVQWSSSGKATAVGQLAFFAEFLQTSGLFEHWLQSCPCTTPAPTHRRYETSWAPGCWASWMARSATPTSARCVAMAWRRLCWA